MKKVKISDIKLNPNNPRLIKDEKFRCNSCKDDKLRFYVTD